MTADATIPGGLGTFGFDDEGVPAQRTPIVRDGVVRRLPDVARDARADRCGQREQRRACAPIAAGTASR